MADPVAKAKSERVKDEQVVEVARLQDGVDGGFLQVLAVHSRQHAPQKLSPLMEQPPPQSVFRA